MKDKIKFFLQTYSFSLFLILFSLAYTVYGFKGIDFHSGYHGNTYKTIYPDSFPKDRYFPSTRPTAFSLFYVLVRFLGKICLDDRFFFLVYLAWVVAAVIALDKIIQTLQVKSKLERAALLSIFFVQHRFK